MYQTELEEKQDLLKSIEAALVDAEAKVRNPPRNYGLTPVQVLTWRDYCAGAAAVVREQIRALRH